MKIEPNNIQEALDLIFNVLNQGDSRYNDSEGEEILADFLINKAVTIEQREIPYVEIPPEDKTEVCYLKEVQWGEKSLAKALLKLEGFSDSEIKFERRFMDSRPDVITESEKKLISVECCSCRISKIINFLSDADELWIITRGIPSWEKPLSKDYLAEWFIFQKGPNWEERFNKLQEDKWEELKKVHSPIDDLMSEN